MNAGIQLLVIAKAPVPGRTKTRLCPPLNPQEASALARAALEDTLGAVAAAPAARRVLVLDGAPGPWLPAGFEVIAQRGDGLAARLAAAFEDAGTPSLLIGMDTPQVTPQLLERACETLSAEDADAVLGATHDGGYWAIGLERDPGGAFAGVPMSTRYTFRAQRERLASLGLRCGLLPRLRDVDHFEDACAVADERPVSNFAYELARISGRVGRIGA